LEYDEFKITWYQCILEARRLYLRDGC